MAGTALRHRALPASPLMMRRRWGEPRQGVGIVRGSASGHEEPFRSPESNDGFSRKRTGRVVRIFLNSATAVTMCGRNKST